MPRASPALSWLLLFCSTLVAAPATLPSPSPFEQPLHVAPAGAIDRAVLDQLKQLGIQPSGCCSDGVFARRVFLDLIGTLPTAREVRSFLESKDPQKRRLLIDQLLERPEFADYWSMKWADLLRVKAEFPINLWPNAVQAYHKWIWQCVSDNLPYDQFARKLLTSSGSNFRVPPVNFYRAVQVKDPPSLAQAVGLTLMGQRTWSKEQLEGMAGFFGRIGYKSTLEWKEEIVFFDFTKPLPAAAVFPDGTTAKLTDDQDPRVVFADWLITPTNPWFTRNIANRAWSWLVGRGVIHEPDDIRPDNPPSNPQLLAVLERLLIENKYDLKQFFRLVLNSQTYQLSSVPRSKHKLAAAHFAFYPVRRMEAEVLIDALCQITGTSERYTSPIPEPFTFIPEEQRTIALADASISSSFLELFGRSPRDTGLELERNSRFSPSQRLHLLNSTHIQRKLTQGKKLQAILDTKGGRRAVVTELYLTILSRLPTDSELAAIENHAQTTEIRGREALIDVAWALINSAEFLYRH